MSLSFKKTCNVAIASVALAVSQHFAGEKVYQGSCFVKEAGALNMKLQMQRSVLAEVTAKSRVPPPRRDDVAVNVVNYSYTGHRSSGLQEKGVDPRDKNVVIVDPAGAHFMKSNVRGNQANGLSAMLYRLIRSDGNGSGHYGGYWTKEKPGEFLWHPTTSIPLPAEASTNLKEAGDAFYVYYNKDMVNDEVELTNELSVIHSIGPDGQVYKEESINDFKEILFHTYANAFTQFRDRCHGKKELWINPVSSGIFAPSWMKAYGKWKSDEYLKEFAELTAEVVKKAINESKIQGVDIKMHIFVEAEFDAFNNAFGEVFADNDNQANLGASLLRSAETLAVAEACTPDKAGELQKIQTDRRLDTKETDGVQTLHRQAIKDLEERAAGQMRDLEERILQAISNVQTTDGKKLRILEALKIVFPDSSNQALPTRAEQMETVSAQMETVSAQLPKLTGLINKKRKGGSCCSRGLTNKYHKLVHLKELLTKFVI